MTFRENFRLALQSATPRLLDCMEMLLNQDDYVDLDTLTNHCDGRVQNVMMHFSQKFSQYGNQNVARRLYLCVRINGNIVEAYRLKPELHDIVEEILTQMGRHGGD